MLEAVEGDLSNDSGDVAVELLHLYSKAIFIAGVLQQAFSDKIFHEGAGDLGGGLESAEVDRILSFSHEFIINSMAGFVSKSADVT